MIPLRDRVQVILLLVRLPALRSQVATARSRAGTHPCRRGGPLLSRLCAAVVVDRPDRRCQLSGPRYCRHPRRSISAYCEHPCPFHGLMGPQIHVEVRLLA
jgi:hypothetical protein